jgi:hypothetical protein
MGKVVVLAAVVSPVVVVSTPSAPDPSGIGFTRRHVSASASAAPDRVSVEGARPDPWSGLPDRRQDPLGGGTWTRVG